MVLMIKDIPAVAQDVHALNRSCCVEMGNQQRPLSGMQGSCAFASQAGAAALTDAGAAVHAEEEAQNSAEEEEEV